MASLKSRINFNKIRNKNEKIKVRLKRKKADNDDKPKKQKSKRRIWYGILSVITFCAIAAIFAVIAFGTYIVINAPDFNEENLYDKESTVIYDMNGNVIATLGMNVGEGEVEKRIKLSYDELPEVLVDALVATEDSRFFQHNGVDIARFLKAAFGQVLGHSDAGGASTLTMQLSKNALTSTEDSGIAGILRKFTDVYMAVFKIEKQYTKQDIIEMYLNSEFEGNQAYGVEQAAKTYFGKSAKDVSLSEAALLVGLFQAPGAYDPYSYPEKAESRRNQVLSLMVRHGYISQEEAEIAKKISVTSMLTPYASNANPYQGYIDTVIEEVENKYKISPYTVPLKIYTYLDTNKQNVINNLYNGNAGYEFVDEKIQLAIAVVDNSNGHLVAVGARRNSNGERLQNYATQISRHPGSTIKPILDYGPAFEYLNWNTYGPAFDEPVTYTSGGTMHNWNNGNVGVTTIRYGLSQSLNTVALQTFRATTNEQKWNFATSLGVTPGNSNGVILESASIGAFDGLNPVQLAGAYSAFASGGYFTEPHAIDKIVYIDTGEEEQLTYSRERVMKETTAWLLSKILQDVTPSTARVSGTEIATKTGTSSYDESILRQYGLPTTLARDSWTASYNPDYTITYWYGYDELDPDYNMTIYRATTERNQIMGYLAPNIFNTGSTFTMPSGITTAKIELQTSPARLASSYTPGDIVETHYFIKGTEPTEESPRYAQLTDPSNLIVIEDDTSATLSWKSPGIPDVINPTWLRTYFNNGYGQFADKYYQARLEYNTNAIGDFGFDIYLRKGNDLTYVGWTKDTNYEISNTAGYDSVVVKSAYSLFKTNASNGISYSLTGSSTSFEIELEGIETQNGIYVNPTFSIGSTLPDLGINTIKFVVNQTDITDSITEKSYVIEDCSTACKKVDKIDTSKKGEYEITYYVTYLGNTYEKQRAVHIK